MLKLLSFAALSYVAAADVPVFSSNDDYDEINLNVRLLQANITTAPANSTGYTVSGTLTATYNGQGSISTTEQGFCSDVSGPTCAALETSTGATKGSCAITSCGYAAAAAAPASSDARKLQIVVDDNGGWKLALDQAYAIVFASAAAANTATATISDAAFASSFATALNSELAAADVGLTATVDTVGTPTSNVPPPAPAASPSPSPSSDASTLKANVALAAVAALFASVF